MECPLESEEHEQTGDTTSTTNLPAIDLLLNPGRATELSQVQRWVEERAENITLTEVVLILRVLYTDEINRFSGFAAIGNL